MPNEAALRKLAREVLRAGKLPHDMPFTAAGRSEKMP